MADTFESVDYKSPLETFEWDNVWIEHTENTTSKRVLYIGDSISCGTFRQANAVADGRILFDSFGTSKALDNPHFYTALTCFMQQLPHCEAVLFNNGNHGFHMDGAAYEEGLRQMIAFLRKAQPVPLYLLTSTASNKDEKLSACIRSRNEIVWKLAKECDCPVIDLYSVGEQYSDLHLDDGVHFSTEGYRHFAQLIVETLQN